jgi:hypothetical protein
MTTQEKNVLRVLFTGGAHGGKTSVIEAVKQAYEKRGWKVLVIRESATDFIQTLGTESVDVLRHLGTDGGLFFQTSILSMQASREWIIEEYLNMCAYETRALILFDRGGFDGKAFLHESSITWDDVVREAGVRMDDVTFRPIGLCPFDHILHLESQSVSKGGGYATVSENTATFRTQNREQALVSERKLVEVYAASPARTIVHSTPSFSEKVSCVLRVLGEITGSANERI